MVTTKRKQQRLINWSLKPSGPVSAAALSTVGLLAGGELGYLAEVAPVVGAMGAMGGAMGQVAVAAGKDAPPSALAYRLACWGGAGGWLSWTLAQGLSSNSAAALAAGAAVAGVCSQLGKIPPRGTSGRAGTGLVVRAGGERGLAWERRLARVCGIKGAVVTDVTGWPTGAGYDVHVDLPTGGATRKQMLAYAEGLASDARLPEGCSVRILPGAHRGAVVLRVATVNRLASVIDYPADYSPRSTLDPVAFGELADASAAEALLRELAVLIAGIRGSGKTTLLQVITLGLLRCTDHLVWHLDLNGGGVTQPWIDVWLDGRVERCPIDWAAAGPTEAKYALKAAVRVAKHRKASYRALKRQANQSLLPISESLPQITVVVDEGAEAVKDRELSELIGQLQNIGRNEAVNLVLCALRPTSDLVPVNMRKQSGVRVQMHGPDEEELSHMFGWNRGISLEDLAGRGTAFLSVEGATPIPFRVYNLTPRQIEAAALAVAAHRPQLDEASAHAAGENYATRYQRMRDAFGGDTVDAGDETHVPAMAAAGAAHQHGPFTVYTGGTGRGFTPDPDQWDLPGLPGDNRPPAPRVPADPADWDLPGLPGNDPRPAPAALPASGPLARALEAFERVGDTRMHSERLAEEVGAESVWALAETLKEYGIKPRPKFMRDGEERRGYYLSDIQDAAKSAALHAGPGSRPAVQA